MEKLKRFLHGLPVCLLLAASLSGCRVTRYVPVETVRIDTTYVSQIIIDSVYHRDSVFVESKGDTVVLEKYKYIYKYVLQRDTLWRERMDTIQVAYPVEAQLTSWQKVKMGLGQAFIIVLCLGLAGLISYLLLKKR